VSGPEARRRRGLTVGDPLPEFSGTTESGTPLSRSDLLGRPTVLFFYPKAGSPGCTLETREFARRSAEFVGAGVRVVGVSVDRPEAQQRFRDQCQLPFPLLADADGSISRRFGVLGALGVARRTTFLLGADGHVLEVVRSWRPRRHVEVALDRLARGSAGASTSDRPPARTT
jgi:thioredoxin-dependent peroxiredoxin